jgi:hypothetical protein
MTQQPVPPERYPWWVKLTLLGFRTRRSQWIWVSFEVLTIFVLVYLALTETDGATRALYLIAALWAFIVAAVSFRTITWVDRNGEWKA